MSTDVPDVAEDSEVSQSKMMAVLDWAYDKAVNGVAGLDSAVDIANSYMKNNDSPYEQANSLIRWQNAKAGTSGFITGLGGFLVMPVAIPANLASVMYVQIRMIAAIAHIGGHDLKDDRVKSLIYTCMAGNAAKDILKDVGIQVGKKLTETAIKNISGKTLTRINQAVGFKLVTKAGEKSVFTLTKAIPFIGGVIGASFDIASTNTIGNIARDTFIEKTP